MLITYVTNQLHKGSQRATEDSYLGFWIPILPSSASTSASNLAEVSSSLQISTPPTHPKPPTRESSELATSSSTSTLPQPQPQPQPLPRPQPHHQPQSQPNLN